MDFALRGTPTPRYDRPGSGRPPSAKPQFTRNPITVCIIKKYCNEPKFLDRQVWANSADPDQTAPTGAV